MKADVKENEIKTGLRGNAQEQHDAICKAYERYANPLASFILEDVAKLDATELTTAVNNVFIALAKKARAGTFKQEGSLASLLFTMARRKAIDIVRQNERREQREISVDDFGRPRMPDVTEESSEEISELVARALREAPEIAAIWKKLAQTRTAADETLAEELFRQFKIFVGSLPGLQRKVAGIVGSQLGKITSEEICEKIAQTGVRPLLSSVKSARREIREKFRAFLKNQERRLK